MTTMLDLAARRERILMMDEMGTIRPQDRADYLERLRRVDAEIARYEAERRVVDVSVYEPPLFHEPRVEDEAAAWLARISIDPLESRYWSRRTSYLRNPRLLRLNAATWEHRETYAGRAAKRRWQWATDSFAAGYLSARAFHAETVRMEIIVLALFEIDCRDQRDRPLGTIEQIAREERRLRKMGRLEFVDRVAWTRLSEAVRANRERRDEWARQRAERTETRRQRALLRQGHETLKEIRRWLRLGAARLPSPE